MEVTNGQARTSGVLLELGIDHVLSEIKELEQGKCHSTMSSQEGLSEGRMDVSQAKCPSAPQERETEAETQQTLRSNSWLIQSRK